MEQTLMTDPDRGRCKIPAVWRRGSSAAACRLPVRERAPAAGMGTPAGRWQGWRALVLTPLTAGWVRSTYHARCSPSGLEAAEVACLLMSMRAAWLLPSVILT
jgi:hypothetical protein